MFLDANHTVLTAPIQFDLLGPALENILSRFLIYESFEQFWQESTNIKS